MGVEYLTVHYSKNMIILDLLSGSWEAPIVSILCMHFSNLQLIFSMELENNERLHEAVELLMNESVALWPYSTMVIILNKNFL